MTSAKPKSEYGKQPILEENWDTLSGGEGYRNVDGSRYVVFSYEDAAEDGIEVVPAEDIREILNDDEEEFPLMKRLQSSLERANIENSKGANLRIAEVASGEVKDAGYLLKDGEIDTVLNW